MRTLTIETPHTNIVKGHKKNFVVDSEFIFQVYDQGYIYYACKDASLYEVKSNAFRIYSMVLNEQWDMLVREDRYYAAIVKTPKHIQLVRNVAGIGYNCFYAADKLSFSLKELVQADSKISTDAISTFLQYGFIPAPSTIYEGISKLAPGQFLTFDETMQAWKPIEVLHHLLDSSYHSGTLTEASETYRKMHESVVDKYLYQASQKAVLLSGGFDSGGNLAAARAVTTDSLHAFSIGFENAELSEVSLAAKMAEHFGALHTFDIIDQKALNPTLDILANLDEPFFENGIFVNQRVMQLVSKKMPNATVIGGDANDQPFGTSTQKLALHHLTRKFGILPIIKALAKWQFIEKHLFKYHFFLKTIVNALEPEFFGFSKSDLQKLMNNPLATVSTNRKPEIKNNFESLYNQRNLHADFMQTGLQIIAHKASLFAKNYKINLRFPYLNPEIIGYVQNLPVSYRVGGSIKQMAMGKAISKYVFKNAYKNILPDYITQRPKQGGFTPLSVFFKLSNLRQGYYKSIIENLGETRIFNRTQLEAIIANIESSIVKPNNWIWKQQENYIKIMHLLVLARWIENNK